MEKSQFLEEIKSTAENCYKAGYKCGYEAEELQELTHCIQYR